MARRMKAAIFVEPGRIVLDEKPIPEPGPLDALLRRHAPAAMDCDLLAPGFRRIGFATWAIELAILPDRAALAIVPRGRAAGFEALAALHMTFRT